MIFERSLRREVLSAAGAVFTTLFTITITFMLIRILGQASGGKVASDDVMLLIGFASLDYLPIILILTGFISVLLVVTRVYQDSEMVVWFASGVSLTRWIKPIFSIALPLMFLISFLSLVLSPWANQQTVEVRASYEKREDLARVSPGKFQEFPNSDRISFIEAVSGDLNQVQNIFIKNIVNGKSIVIVAKEGKIEVDQRGDRFLVMNQGRRYDGLPTDGDFQMMQFEKYAVLVATKSKVTSESQSAKILPLQTLLSDPKPYYLGELLWRISLPIMGFILMFLAIPLGYVNPRVGRSANLIIALILVVLNLNLLNIFQSAVAQETLHFRMAWWPMHLGIISIVVALFYWRLKVNSRLHPKVLWSRLKGCMRKKEKKPCLQKTLNQNDQGVNGL
jgi:lipopolysaccharide export system permease protein